jgi:hypothetical protein
MPISPMYPVALGLHAGITDHSTEGPTRDTFSADHEACRDLRLTEALRCSEDPDAAYYPYKYLYKDISDTETRINCTLLGPVPTCDRDKLIKFLRGRCPPDQNRNVNIVNIIRPLPVLKVSIQIMCPVHGSRQTPILPG